MSSVDPRSALAVALFEASSDAIVIVDEGGLIRHVNPAAVNLLGYSRDGLLGESIELLIPHRHTHHAALRERYAAAPRPRAMGTTLELAARHASGLEIPVDVALTPLAHDGDRWVAAALRDMRGRTAAGATLRVQATALRSAANGIVITDRGGTITWVNPAACAITGYTANELIGNHTRTLKSGVHDAAFYAELWAAVVRGDTWSGTIVNRRKDGALYHEEQTIAPVVDEDGTVTHFIAIKQDVTERHRAQEALTRAQADLAARVAEIESLNRRLREQAIRDPLTGLYNRRYLDDTIARDLARAARRHEPVAVLMLDVDHFKAVNDAHGHGTGDRALIALARTIEASIRASDVACRYGGEEFVVVMPGAPPEIARTRADALRERFARTGFVDDGDASRFATVSIGVAEVRAGARALDEALVRADRALYAAKHGGRDRVCLDGAP